MRLIKLVLIPLISCFIILEALCINAPTSLNSRVLYPGFIKVDSKPEKLNIIMVPLYSNGDCTMIKYGNTEVLIDMGGSVGPRSLASIQTALSTYVTDGCLEYLVITHGDRDHLCNFNNPFGLKKWLQSKNSYVDTLIDFDINADDTITTETFVNKELMYKNNNLFDFNLESGSDFVDDYAEYVEMREALLEEQLIKHHYTASQCTMKFRPDSKIPKKISNQYNNIFNLYYDKNKKDDAKTCPKLEILYNYYYDHSFIKSSMVNLTPTARDYNLLSVCCLITFGDDQFLFTGDLEEYDSSGGKMRVGGEALLVKYNSKLRRGVKFFKAGHHGSATSNSVAFIDTIRPEYVGISCVAGGQFNFPSQLSIDNFSKYTDDIYITTMKTYKSKGKEYYSPNSKGFDEKSIPIQEKYYGEIVYEYNVKSRKVDVQWQNQDITHKDNIFFTPWFIENRQIPFYIYNLSMSKENNISGNQYECVYIKFGNIDILANCGVDRVFEPYKENTLFDTTLGVKSNNIENELVKKICRLCNDHVLDYVIVSDSNREFYSTLIEKGGLIDEIMNNEENIDGDYISYIDTLLYPNCTTISDNNKLHTYRVLEGFIAKAGKTFAIRKAYKLADYEQINGSKTITLFEDNSKDYLPGDIKDHVSLEFLETKYEYIKGRYDKDNSLAFIFEVSLNNKVFRYMNLGNLYTTENLNYVYHHNNNLSNSINVIQVPNNGYIDTTDGSGFDTSSINIFKNLITDYAKKKEYVLLCNSIAGKQNFMFQNITPVKRFYNAFSGSLYCPQHWNSSAQVVDDINPDMCCRILLGKSNKINEGNDLIKIRTYNPILPDISKYDETLMEFDDLFTLVKSLKDIMPYYYKKCITLGEYYGPNNMS